jgi:hypothetical protein
MASEVRRGKCSQWQSNGENGSSVNRSVSCEMNRQSWCVQRLFGD